MKNKIKLLGIMFIALFFFSCGDDDQVISCTDGILNGSEMGIDCGGTDCSPCATCFDGLLNGSETGVDCGGPDCNDCPTCDDGEMNGSETGIDCGGDCSPCYGVGLPGEAGGIIFYDKGAVTDGWQYLEAAESDFVTNGNLCWGSIQYMTNLETDNNIGTGLENTTSLAEASSQETMYSLAASHIENGKFDWFVPSSDELTLIYENKDFLPNLSNGGSECTLYWSSTLEQISNGNWLAKCMDTSTGEFFFTNPNQRVRLVRRF